MVTAARETKTEQTEFGRPRTRVGWQGISFTLPPDWNLTALSMNPADGYLKVDSPAEMFAQVRWLAPGSERSASLAGLLLAKLAKATHLTKLRKRPRICQTAPDLESILDGFLRTARGEARKTRAAFDSKIRPQREEANGVSRSFSWTGSGVGQGKIWHCGVCGRVVIAQVVGVKRSAVQAAASEMFNGFACHPEGDWSEWALYDLIAAVPSRFRLTEQKALTGYLRLGFRCGAERVLIERWGLASVARKRFTLAEWFAYACQLDRRLAIAESEVAGHAASSAAGRVRGAAAWLRASRDAGLRRPASRYEACAWECAVTNRLFAVQTWRLARSNAILKEIADRCACHPEVD